MSVNRGICQTEEVHWNSLISAVGASRCHWVWGLTRKPSVLRANSGNSEANFWCWVVQRPGFDPQIPVSGGFGSVSSRLLLVPVCW